MGQAHGMSEGERGRVAPPAVRKQRDKSCERRKGKGGRQRESGGWERFFPFFCGSVSGTGAPHVVLKMNGGRVFSVALAVFDVLRTYRRVTCVVSRCSYLSVLCTRPVLF